MTDYANRHLYREAVALRKRRHLCSNLAWFPTWFDGVNSRLHTC